MPAPRPTWSSAQPGDGWRVAMGTLTFERGVSTLGQQIRYARELSGIVAAGRENGDHRRSPRSGSGSPGPGSGLRAMRSYALATMDVERPGQDNVSKLLWANWHRGLGELAMDVLGKAGLVCGDEDSGALDSGSSCSCSPVPTPFTAGPTRSSATSSPSGCSACRER